MTLLPLPVSFYNRPVVEVARDLLGARLLRCFGDQRAGGMIIETEAYMGENDLACHARAGRTPRTEVMYGPAGRAYIYFIYGMHWMLNAVAEPEGSPSAVLIRAIRAEEGEDIIATRRKNTHMQEWTSGPARLCQALEIDSRLNGVNLTDPASSLVIESGQSIPERAIIAGPRIGIQNTPEPWLSQPWRFRIDFAALEKAA